MTTKFEANSCEVYLFGANYDEELKPFGLLPWSGRKNGSI